MFNRKFLNMLVSLMVILTLFAGTNINATAMPSHMPANPTDETKVPHYFGPYPNWANSPFRLPDVTVSLDGGGGSGATAAATVDPVSGAIAAITVTAPGTGYTSAPTVNFASATGKYAAATAVVDYSGTVTAVTVDAAGSTYTAPVVTISGGGATTDATANAFGGVDAATLISGTDYSGYTFPVIEFALPNDPAGTRATGHATCSESVDCTHADGATVTVNNIVVDNPGSGYSAAPSVIVRDGPADAPASALQNDATSTISIQSVSLVSFGSGYTGIPTVAITDTAPGIGSGAAATAAITTSGGSVTTINLINGGQDYMTPGIKKFTDALPGLCVPPACPTSGKYIPLGVPEAKTYNGVAADEYVIGLIQYHTNFSSSLPNTLVRGYVQIETPANVSISQHFPLVNEMLDGTTQPVMINGAQAYGVTAPQWLGPTLIASKDKPVRIVFYNLLPTGSGGDLFLPVDSTVMGSGMGPANMAAPVNQGSVMDEVRNPLCSEYPKPADCFKDNRATLHLHGGTSPWISDGTIDQWITPASENTPWPQGVAVQNVPDMGAAGCDAPNDGCQTFYYTNQQSARLLFYHDHAWGITRLNVYAGEAAGYVITDPTEQKLFGTVNGVPGPYASLGEGIPLVVQDRTFVPDAAQLALQDPTWDVGRWGSKGSFWYHHVYMPAQNPGDPSGMSAYGRWMYGSWFWPPASPTYGPIDNPYFDPNCNLDDPATWQYQTDPFCEPAQIPGTPNISVGMEQFNDTPIVNGVAYPTITLEPKTYRLRMLNAANDRFFNFQWYVADPTTGTDSEVALKASELAAAQLDPNVFPTPDTTVSLPGPDWVQIGSEGGFLPAPTVIDGQQVTTWITDPTRFDVGNVDLHSLLLAPAERADVIVDFSQFAGKTLILYNDAPAAFPARVASYDYYTGAPDLSPAGAPTIVPGYGPNTRTIMQVKIAGTPAPAFNVSALAALFTHKADGSGVFEAGQHPTIVGQAAYNTAYGKNFAASSNCNVPGSSLQRCDGFVRINDTAQFSFNTLLNPITAKLTMPLQPKAIHDEMNSTTFDEFGRMQANLGVEAQPPTPGLQNVTLYPSINPATEIIDGTNLPKGDINVTPISNANDGTQIWRITHNGVDTHPIHFHLFDVQVVNRVTWDNIIIPPDANELGWKDTVRISPLEDTIVALRPIVPNVPFELPNSIRLLNPAMPAGDTSIFNNIDPQGNPTNPIINQLVNFGWEYTYHCHILSHEEMDMMRPVSLALPPNRATGLAAIITGSGNNRRFRISWTDNSINETGFVLQRTSNGTTWINVGTSPSPLNQPNTHGTRSLTDASSNVNAAYLYRVVAQNAVGYGAEFPSMTVQSYSDTLGVNPPLAPSTLAATLQAGPVIRLTWKDNSNNETGFTLQRSTDGVNFNTGISLPANTVSYNDTVAAGAANITYTYQVVAVNIAGSSLPSPTASVIVPAMPLAPSNFSAVNGPNNNNSRSVVLTWTDNSNNETGFTIQRATNANFTGNSVTTVNVGANVTSLTVTGLSRNTSYWFRIRANNGTIIFTGYVNATPFPIVTNP
jgi:FtsP/CotA-like multicopper oxidase with cupredoxin domain